MGVDYIFRDHEPYFAMRRSPRQGGRECGGEGAARARLELLERGVVPDGREVVGDRLTHELVARGQVARDVAREGAAPDLLSAAVVLGDRVAQDEGRREEYCGYDS